ncbi:MAG TPA: septation protein SepH [Nocardioides sp.]|nr:septation protein SepH [Nocardioides sp.]
MTEQDQTGPADDAAEPGAVPLTLTGASPDRLRLLLVDDQGTEFTLDITPGLRAAVRPDTTAGTHAGTKAGTTRVGPMETKMSSSIRPREIQTRIRAGESTEAVAEAAGTTVDAIMPYAAPVLAEREHVAQRALKASLRRTPAEGTAAHTQSRVLGDAVAAHLRGAGADPADVTWDAYRRETGRWVLTGAYTTGGRTGTARFTFDAPGNYALSDNDDARWLVGDVLPEPATPARDDLQQARERRLAVVPEDELPLGTAARTTSDDAAYEAAAYDVDQALDLSLGADAEPREVPEVHDEPIRATADETAAEAARRDAESERAKHRRPVQKKRGRASVPSWDEIMFGGGDQ